MTIPRFGLTGGIGSGKSTVGAMLASVGAVVIDTDRIARLLTVPGGAAIDAIRATFGAEFIAADGGLDRPRMRAAAFDDPGDARSPRGDPPSAHRPRSGAPGRRRGSGRARRSSSTSRC